MNQILFSYTDNEATKWLVGRLHDRLKKNFPEYQFHMGIQPLVEVGDNYQVAIDAAVKNSAGIILFIDQGWVETSHPYDQAALKSAYAHKRPVFALLVNGATLPELTSENSFLLRDEHFREDAKHLMQNIDSTLGVSVQRAKARQLKIHQETAKKQKKRERNKSLATGAVVVLGVLAGVAKVAADINETKSTQQRAAYQKVQRQRTVAQKSAAIKKTAAQKKVTAQKSTAERKRREEQRRGAERARRSREALARNHATRKSAQEIADEKGAARDYENRAENPPW